MIERLVFLSTLPIIHRALAQGECTDVRGRLISHGLHYVPGPDTCTLCVCDNGQPKVCKAVLCSPPQDCRSFRVGNTCCEFICLDDVVKPIDHNEHSFRMAAGGLVGVIILTLILIIYRMRWQRRTRPPHVDDQRSLTSIGYISGSMGYVGGTCETGLSAWKPPSNYLPRGEAPPPYDEAVAQSRAEVLSYRYNNDPNLHRTYPASLEPLTRAEDPMHCAAHNYINLPRPMQQMPNPNNCFTAPLLQQVHNMDMRDPVPIMHHALPHNVQLGFPSAIRLTGSLGTITNRGLLSLLQREPPDHERPHNVPGFYTNNGALAIHSSLHRTIPRISTAIETVLDTPISGFGRTDRSIPNEVRRSFHKPNDRTHGFAETGRSMPRNLNLASNSELSRNIEPILCVNQQDSYCSKVLSTPGRVRPKNMEPADGAVLNKVVQKPVVPSETAAVEPPTATLPLTVDRPSCVCSYAEAAPADAEDYRSECVNCNTASSSRWVLEEGWTSETEEGTQTLQRRAPPATAPAPATATLPQPVTRQRTIIGPPSNWENWFSTIPDSDTESEEE